MGEEKEKPRSGWKGCLIAFLVFVGAPFLLLVGYVVWGLWANDRAERLAAGFCASVRLGDDQARLKTLAEEFSPGNQFPTDDGYRYIWYGMIFHASECRVKLAGGRVKEKEQQRFDD